MLGFHAAKDVTFRHHQIVELIHFDVVFAIVEVDYIADLDGHGDLNALVVELPGTNGDHRPYHLIPLSLVRNDNSAFGHILLAHLHDQKLIVYGLDGFRDFFSCLCFHCQGFQKVKGLKETHPYG